MEPLKLPDPYQIKNRSDIHAAMAEALARPWALPIYDVTAKLELDHRKRVEDAKKMWETAGTALENGAKAIGDATHGVREAWPDPTFMDAFEAPVLKYKGHFESSAGTMRGPLGALDALAMKIDEVNKSGFPPLVTDHDNRINNLVRLQQEIAAMESAPVAGEGGDQRLSDIVGLYQKASDEIAALERIDVDGRTVLNGLEQTYVEATSALEGAAAGHDIGDAPAAGEAPTDPNRAPSAPGGPGGPGGPGPGATPPGGGPQPEAQPPGGGAQPPGGGAQPPGGGAQPPGGGAQPPGGGAGEPTAPGGDPGETTPPDTGLAGAPPSTIPSPTIPDVPGTSPTSPTSPNLPGSTSPGGPGLGGVGGGPLAAGLGGSSRSPGGGGPPNVQQAARQLSSPQGAGIGQAPSLSRLATGTPGAQPGTGMGGVPPMMPPMMPQGAGANGKPKPGTAQPNGAGRKRPAGAAAGVPAGLRGRTGGNSQPRPAVRRARAEAQPGQENQNAELLDSELWEVEQPKPVNSVTERRRVREY